MKRNLFNRKFRRDLIVSLTTLSMVTGTNQVLFAAENQKKPPDAPPILQPPPIIQIPNPFVVIPQQDKKTFSEDMRKLLGDAVKRTQNFQDYLTNIGRQINQRREYLQPTLKEWLKNNLSPISDKPYVAKKEDTLMMGQNIPERYTRVSNRAVNKTKVVIDKVNVKTLCKIKILKVLKCPHVDGIEVPSVNGNYTVDIDPAYIVIGRIQIPVLTEDDTKDPIEEKVDYVGMPFFAGRYSDDPNDPPFTLFNIPMTPVNFNRIKQEMMENNKKSLQNKIDNLLGLPPTYTKDVKIEIQNDIKGNVLNIKHIIPWEQEDLGWEVDAGNVVKKMTNDLIEQKLKLKGNNQKQVKKQNLKDMKKIETDFNNKITNDYQKIKNGYQQAISNEKDPMKQAEIEIRYYSALSDLIASIRTEYEMRIMGLIPGKDQGAPEFREYYKLKPEDLPRIDYLHVDKTIDPVSNAEKIICFYQHNSKNPTQFEKEVDDEKKKNLDRLNQARLKKAALIKGRFKKQNNQNQPVPNGAVQADINEEGPVKIKPKSRKEKQLEKEKAERERKELLEKGNDDAKLRNRDELRAKLEELIQNNAPEEELMKVAKDLVEVEKEAKKVEEKRQLNQRLADAHDLDEARKIEAEALILKYKNAAGHNQQNQEVNPVQPIGPRQSINPRPANENLNPANENPNHENENLNPANENPNHENENLNPANENLNPNLNNQNGNAHRQENENENENKENPDPAKEKPDLDKKYAPDNYEAEQAWQFNQELADENTELRNKIQRQESKISKYKATIADQKTKIDKQQNNINSLKNTISDLEEDNAYLKSVAKGSVATGSGALAGGALLGTESGRQLTTDLLTAGRKLLGPAITQPEITYPSSVVTMD